MIKKITRMLSVLGLICVSFISYAVLPQSIKIGSDTSYAPFDYIDATGKITGFNIEITQALCDRLKIECQFTTVDFDALIPSLQSRKIDMISSSLMITEKREKQIAFSDHIFAAYPRLIAKENSDLLPNVESLKGKRIGVEQGTTQEHYAKDVWRQQGVKIISYQNQMQVFSDLIAGRLDASLQAEVTGSYAFLKQPEGKGFAFAGPTLVNEQYFGVGAGLGFRKNDNELREAFNKALAEILADGTYHTINNKYFDFNIYGNEK